MVSYENELWAGDGHSIFDVKSSKCINRNLTGVFHPKNQLVIGDHVWVGKQAFLIHGTNIGSGSIVGARSVVKGIFPNNCSIAGNPATSVKEDVAWSRDCLLYTSDMDIFQFVDRVKPEPCLMNDELYLEKRRWFRWDQIQSLPLDVAYLKAVFGDYRCV